MSDVVEAPVADEVVEPVVDDVTEPSTAPVGEPMEVPADEPSPGISDALIGRAKGYGLSQADLEGLDDARVGRMFAAIDRRIMQPQVQPPIQAPPPGLPGLSPAGAGEYAPLAIEFGDDLDESVVGPIKTVVGHLNEQLKQVHASRQQVQNELRAMNVLREFSEFDRFVTGLGDEWASDYGSGATADMDPHSSEFQKRLEVYHGAKSLRADAQRQRQRMSASDALKRSHHAVHWDRIAEHERLKLNGKIERRQRGSGERPVKGRQAAISPRDEAIAAWK